MFERCSFAAENPESKKATEELYLWYWSARANLENATNNEIKYLETRDLIFREIEKYNRKRGNPNSKTPDVMFGDALAHKLKKFFFLSDFGGWHENNTCGQRFRRIDELSWTYRSRYPLTPPPKRRKAEIIYFANYKPAN